MVIAAFPAAKLGALLLKQISKPIATVVKNHAKNHPVFRKYVCMPPAQFYNWCEIKAKMWILNLGKPVNIPVLSEAMAIELGANLLGEAIIFIIAAGILVSEYNRSVKKEAAKEEAKKQEMRDLQSTIKELFIQTEEQGAHIRELTRKMHDIETLIGKIPERPKPKIPLPLPKSVQPETEPEKSTKSGQNNYIQPGIEHGHYTEGNQNNVIHSSIRHNQMFNKRGNLIFRAVNDIEDQFWGYPYLEQQNGILILSLYHLGQVFKWER